MVVIKCPKHPRYTAQISPRAACQPCITLYNLKLRAIADRLEVKP